MEDHQNEARAVERQSGMKVALSWLKKNTKTVVFVFLTVLVLLLIALGFWLKIRGFKISNLLYKLQEAEAKNEINHLQVKQAVLLEKDTVATAEVKELKGQIQVEKKKAETARLKVKGLSSEELADELTNLGF